MGEYILRYVREAVRIEKLRKLLKYNFSEFPLTKGSINKDGNYEYNIPIEWFDRWKVHEKETGKFIGWVNAKKKCIEKYEVTMK